MAIEPAVHDPSPEPSVDSVIGANELTRSYGEGEAAVHALRGVSRSHIGFIFQFFNLLPMLTAEENVLLPLEIAGSRPDAEWHEAVMRKVGLTDRRTHRPAELSGGQQQRVAVARAIVAKPVVMFADEPTGKLDSRTGAEILGLLRDMFASGRFPGGGHSAEGHGPGVTHDYPLGGRMTSLVPRSMRLLRVSRSRSADLSACGSPAGGRSFKHQKMATGGHTMTRSHPIARELALGATVNAAVLGTWLGALVLWARRCEAHKGHVH
jgi:predicted ABC-type transport system involved in lysophospholipase L1 biosynthesis ATPase subunit